MSKQNRINNKNFRKLSDLKRLDQSLTNESKNARIRENALTRKLNGIATEISKFTSTDISLLRRVFDAPVTEVIRANIQRAYVIGMNYSADFYETDGFLTQQDFDQIKDVTMRYVDMFWRFVQTGILHRNDLLLRDKKGNVKPFKEPLTNTRFIASAAIIRTLNIATIMKARQLRRRNQSNPIGYRFASELTDFGYDTYSETTDLELVSNQSPEEFMQQTIVKLVWKTADDFNVCPICNAFDGNIYELEDSSTPVPPDDTHPHCRCRLMLTEVDQFDEPINASYDFEQANVLNP